MSNRAITRISDVPGITRAEEEDLCRGEFNVYEAQELLNWARAGGFSVTDMSKREKRRVLSVIYNRRVSARDDAPAVIAGMKVGYSCLQTALRMETFEAARSNPWLLSNINHIIHAGKFEGLYNLLDDTCDLYGLKKRGNK